MFKHLESMLICSRKYFSHFFQLIFAFLKWKIGAVALFLKPKTSESNYEPGMCTKAALKTYAWS